MINTKSKDEIHVAHSFFCNNEKLTDFQILLLLASVLYFRKNNPICTFDLYCDKKSSKKIKELNNVFHIYDNVNDTIIEEKIKMHNINTKVFFSFPKFVALEQLSLAYKGPICVLDIDIIINKNVSELIYKNDLCCTHFETRDNMYVYPSYEKIHPSPHFKKPKINNELNIHAANCSFLSINNKNLLEQYLDGVYTYFENNLNIETVDMLWAEQVYISFLASANNAKFKSLLENCICNTNSYFFKPNSWKFYDISVLHDEDIQIFHIWQEKVYMKPFSNYELFSILRLLSFIDDDIDGFNIEHLSSVTNFDNYIKQYKEMKNNIDLKYKTIVKKIDIRRFIFRINWLILLKFGKYFLPKHANLLPDVLTNFSNVYYWNTNNPS